MLSAPLKPAVVTGAAGHLGANLTRALLEHGRTVRCLVRDDVRALEGLGVEQVRGDVLDAASLAKAFVGADTVFHLAARISLAADDGAQLEQVNVGGVRNVIDACLAAGVRRLVHFSSIQALHDSGAETDEDAALAQSPQLSAYERSKVAGERAVLDAAGRGLDAVTVTPTAALGPHDWKPSRAGRALLSLARGRLPALVDGGFDWVDARDVARGAIAAEEKGRAGARYLLAGSWRTLSEVAQLVHAQGGARPPRLLFPLGLAAAVVPLAVIGARLVGVEPVLTRASVRALRSHRHVVPRRSIAELGWAPRPLEATIADTLAWFREAGRR